MGNFFFFCIHFRTPLVKFLATPLVLTILIYIYVVSVDLGGNPSTIFLLVYALIAGVIGECSVILGFAYLRVWNNASLAGAATSAIISWAVTALAFGYFIWFS